MKRILAPIAIIATLLLAGCSGPSKDADYKDVNDLATAYKQAVGGGMDCFETKNDIHDHDWVQTTCGPTAIVMMFTSDAIREEVKKKNPLESGRRFIQGKNWLIEGDQYEIEKAHEVLGGELLK
ncbi:hypothetical protein [Arthrobacter sp. V4I6]|uniref:hypothetical protein n=1 Tax=Arthrobacter sp. V4I6 TaxID=3042281 RepID=UPI0027D7CC5F|nr:hypothetical protein [Arthrobacter sp. V4I6]